MFSVVPQFETYVWKKIAVFFYIHSKINIFVNALF